MVDFQTSRKNILFTLSRAKTEKLLSLGASTTTMVELEEDGNKYTFLVEKNSF